MNRYTVIMAGGEGLRFWPLSRQSKPKQFISVDGAECMMVQTIKRVIEIVPPENCYVITNKNLLDITRQTVKDILPTDNIITEPERKDTAACIAYAAMFIRKRCGRGVLCFLPADGYVKDEESYREALMQAFETAEKRKKLVVIGIVPTYPATGYGYIKIDKTTENSVAKVYDFTEKPDAGKAADYVESGEYLWNGGIVFGQADVIIHSLKKCLPEHFKTLNNAVMHSGESDYQQLVKEAFKKLEKISFDYGVLENTKNIYAVKGKFDWDDVGSLDALSKTLKKDKNGNAVWGDFYGSDTSNSVIYSKDMLVATIGIKDMIIVAADDAMIVCPRNRAQDIKPFVGKLESNDLKKYR